VSRSEDAVVLQDVSHVYRTATARVEALHEVSLTVRRGAVTSVVGVSGSGKSTLLRLVAGFNRPGSGRVVVDGRDLRRSTGGALRRLRRDSVGYLFQRPSDNFVPYLTVGEHLTLERPAAPAPDPFELASRLGLGDKLGRLPVHLSGGEQQRGAVAQLLSGGRAVILADEPTAELDDRSAAVLLREIRELADEGATFLLATHDEAVLEITDVVVRLEHGRLRGQPVRGERAPRDRRESAALDLEPDVGTPVVRLSEVRKDYWEGEGMVRAVREANMEVFPAEVVAVVGRSGSGKTTLLNIIAGWEHPDRGTVEWDLDGGRPQDWSTVAVVPQRLGLMDELTIEENVMLPAQLGGADAADTVDRLLDGLGLSHLRGRFPFEASVGEQQRTALVRALSLRPRVILADEPTSHQDRESAAAIFRAIREAAARDGTAFVVATHDPEIPRGQWRTLHMTGGELSSAT